MSAALLCALLAWHPHVGRPVVPCSAAAVAFARRVADPRAQRFGFGGAGSPAAPEPDDEVGKLAQLPNQYYDAISNISAPELIKGFADSAPPEVQQAVRTTVVQVLGNLPPQLYDMSVASTGQNIASLSARRPPPRRAARRLPVVPSHPPVRRSVLDADDRVHVPLR